MMWHIQREESIISLIGFWEMTVGLFSSLRALLWNGEREINSFQTSRFNIISTWPKIFVDFMDTRKVNTNTKVGNPPLSTRRNSFFATKSVGGVWWRSLESRGIQLNDKQTINNKSERSTYKTPDAAVYLDSMWKDKQREYVCRTDELAFRNQKFSTSIKKNQSYIYIIIIGISLQQI